MKARRYLSNIFVLVIMIFFSPGFAIAQWNTGGDIDHNWVHFGFQLGANSNSFIVQKQPDYNSNLRYTLGLPANNPGNPGASTSGNLSFITSPYTTGFHLGLLANFRLNDNLDVRFTPAVNFSDRVLNYGYESLNAQGGNYSNPIMKTVSSTYVDFPLLLKFKSDRKRNMRAYIIGGLVYSYDIIPSKKTEDAGLDEIAKLVKLNKNALSYRIGIGLDLYYEYFKMSPEISITNDFVNVLKNENNVFSGSLQKLYPSSVQLTLYFE